MIIIFKYVYFSRLFIYFSRLHKYIHGMIKKICYIDTILKIELTK